MSDSKYTLSNKSSSLNLLFIRGIKKEWQIAVILIATLISFFPLFQNGFVNWDDDLYIYENSLIREINLKDFFKDIFHANYHPLVLTAYSVIYKFFGVNPVAYHSISLIFHLLNTLLVYHLFKRLFSLTQENHTVVVEPFIVALLFAIHPMHVESVAWASELKDMMFSFFMLLSLGFYLRYIRGNGNLRFYFLAWILFVFSVLSKATGISLILVLPLLDFFLGRRFSAKVLIEKIPFLIIGIVFGYLANISLAENAESVIEGSAYTIMQRLVLSCYALFSYILKIIMPNNLSAFYPYPVKPGESLPTIYYAYLFLMAVLTSLALYSLKFNRKFIWGIGFFLATLVMMLPIKPAGAFIMADRYTYLPSIGIFYLFAVLFSSMNAKAITMGLKYIGIMIFSIFLGISTYKRTQVWQDSVTFWTDVVHKTTKIALPYYNRGIAYEMNGNFISALNDYTIAIEYDRTNPKPYNNRGGVKSYLGDFKGAISDFDKSIELKSTSEEPFINRGIAKCMMKDFSGAIKDFDDAIRMNNKNPSSYFNRGNLYYSMSDYKNAISDYTHSIKLNPNGDSQTYKMRGHSRIVSGDVSEGCKDLEIAASMGDESARVLIDENCR